MFEMSVLQQFQTKFDYKGGENLHILCMRCKATCAWELEKADVDRKLTIFSALLHGICRGHMGLTIPEEQYKAPHQSTSRFMQLCPALHGKKFEDLRDLLRQDAALSTLSQERYAGYTIGLLQQCSTALEDLSQYWLMKQRELARVVVTMHIANKCKYTAAYAKQSASMLQAITGGWTLKATPR